MARAAANLAFSTFVSDWAAVRDAVSSAMRACAAVRSVRAVLSSVRRVVLADARVLWVARSDLRAVIRSFAAIGCQQLPNRWSCGMVD